MRKGKTQMVLYINLEDKRKLKDISEYDSRNMTLEVLHFIRQRYLELFEGESDDCAAVAGSAEEGPDLTGGVFRGTGTCRSN